MAGSGRGGAAEIIQRGSRIGGPAGNNECNQDVYE